MMCVSWFGFNAGSALAADGAAGMAMLVTQVATASAAMAWMLAEWAKHGKPSADRAPLAITSSRRGAAR